MGNEKTEIIELDENDFLKCIKEAGLESSLTNYTQRIGDKRVSEGLKSYEKNKQRDSLTEKERITELENEIKSLKNGIAKGDLDTLIKTELKKEGLNEDLIKYIRVEDSDKVVESVKALKEDILNLKQKEIDIKLKEGEIPKKGETIAVDSVMEKFVEGKNVGKTGSPFEGKEAENKGD